MGKSDVFTINNSDVRPTKDDPPVFGILRGIISKKRMNELVLRYRGLPSYICRVSHNDEDVSTLGPLEVSVFEESFRARLCFPIHPFIKRLLSRYGLVST